MSEKAISEAVALGSLSGPALLGLMVIILAMIVWHLYKTLHKETQEKTKELISETKSTNNLIREQITISKANSDNLVKFIEAHCSKTNEKLEDLKDDVARLDTKIINLTQIRNKELRNSYERNTNE